MTSLAASQMKLADRGTIKEGFFADLVVFDPKTVADIGTFEKPQQYPVGIDTVIVNGSVTVDGGRHTGAQTEREGFEPSVQRSLVTSPVSRE